jgi:hypothetical protein
MNHLNVILPSIERKPAEVIQFNDGNKMKKSEKFLSGYLKGKIDEGNV